MFTVALFTVGHVSNRCSLTDEWIRKMWCIYKMEYYSATKRNTFESVLMRWTNLEPIIQSEVSQKEKYKCHILMLGGIGGREEMETTEDKMAGWHH